MTPMLRRFLSGDAIIFMLHEIQANPEAELMTGTSVSLFEGSLGWLRRHGWDFATLDDCMTRLASGKPMRPCAVITFDDAYRDLVGVAVPILERFDAPLTVYVPTASLTRTLSSWWLGLRVLLSKNDRVAIDSMGRQFRCADRTGKLKALSAVSAWIHQDYRRAAALVRDLQKAGISLEALNDAYFLGEPEFKALARHPLVSVGGHTVSHPALATLDYNGARREIADNRKYLEELVEQPVRHFAYPYGTATSFGPRDEQIVSELGFDTAVSARKDCVGSSISNRFSLPRVPIGGRFGKTPSLEAGIRGIQLFAQRLRSRGHDERESMPLYGRREAQG